MKKLLITASILILAGCASGYKVTTGNPLFTPSNVLQIENGMNKQEVLKLIGPPETKTDMPPLGEMWVYSGSEMQTKTASFLAPPQQSGIVRSATIMFDQSGHVTQVSKTETNPYQSVSISSI